MHLSVTPSPLTTPNTSCSCIPAFFWQELAKTYHFDKKGEVGPGEQPYLELPVLSVYKVRFGRQNM